MAYCVTAKTHFSNKREVIARQDTKEKAMESAKQLRRNMRIAIPKYKWASSIRVEECK